MQNVSLSFLSGLKVERPMIIKQILLIFSNIPNYGNVTNNVIIDM